jgi:hypothetical protein
MDKVGASSNSHSSGNPLLVVGHNLLSTAAGLDIEKDAIIEIACLVSDGNLKTVIEVSSRTPA